MKYKPFPMPTSPFVTDTWRVVEIGGHPHMVYVERRPNERNQFRDYVHVEPFEEEANDWTLGQDEPEPHETMGVRTPRRKPNAQ